MRDYIREDMLEYYNGSAKSEIENIYSEHPEYQFIDESGKQSVFQGANESETLVKDEYYFNAARKRLENYLSIETIDLLYSDPSKKK